MNLRIICWNMRRAGVSSGAWEYLEHLSPDIALLQEVGSVPPAFTAYTTCLIRNAGSKSGGHQRFKTVVLAKAAIQDNLPLSSRWPWVNDELDRLTGNFVGCKLMTSWAPVQVFSVYCPAWPIARERLMGIDVSDVKLSLNPDVWPTELLWAGLMSQDLQVPTIVGGDLNASETFDAPRPRGNQEVLERMKALGLTDVLRRSKGELTPTFKNPRGGKVIHQIDHLFVSESLLDRLVCCETGEADRVFGEDLSDHLPIVADFKFED